jgi:ankyrin repeat protein
MKPRAAYRKSLLLSVAFFMACAGEPKDGCDILYGVSRDELAAFARWLDRTPRSQWYCKGQPLLQGVLDLGSLGGAMQLLERGVPVNEVGPGNGTAIRVAGTWASIEIAAFLLRHGANVDSADDRGTTAVMAAAVVKPESVGLDFLNFMAGQGADLSLLDRSGRDAAAIAEANGNNAFARRARALLAAQQHEVPPSALAD